jgi:hypothetical protein
MDLLRSSHGPHCVPFPQANVRAECSIDELRLSAAFASF